MIKKVDRQTKAKIEALHAADGQTYALLYLRLLKKLQRVDTQSFILVLIADALTGACHSFILNIGSYMQNHRPRGTDTLVHKCLPIRP